MAKRPKDMKTEVLVVGGGPGGVAAAIAASRGGAKTLLVERYGFLGGMATVGLVNPFMVSRFPSGELIMSPIFKEIIMRLKSRNAAKEGELFGQPHIEFDPELLKIILFDMVGEYKVQLSLHSFATGISAKDGRLTGIEIRTKSGQVKILACVTVDATGDADIAARSGAPYELGRDKDGLMQPATLNFRVGGVNTDKMPGREEINKLFLMARQEGRIKFEREKLLWFETTIPGELQINATRITGIDGTRAEDITCAEREGRDQVDQVFKFLKGEVPGFESSFIAKTATQVGIRETRRIIGDHVLTEDDVLSGRKFEDAIAKCSYPIDIHDPKGKGTIFKTLSKPYDIPYRCLIPKKVKNLIVAGRPISVTHEAFSSTRVMPTCFAVGEAAGIAAALSAKKKVDLRSLNVKDIQKILTGYGANYLRGAN